MKTSYPNIASPRSIVATLPPGTFGEEAVRIFKSLETLIGELSWENVATLRQCLLQEFPGRGAGILQTRTGGDTPAQESLGVYFLNLFPERFHGAIADLTAEELEIVLKHHLSGHEKWGHIQGTKALIGDIIGYHTRDRVSVKVFSISGEKQPIPTDAWSRLGKRFTILGSDFVLGTTTVVRPSKIRIDVGPLTASALKKIQSTGWAEGLHASQKLIRLVEWTLPFYLHPTISFTLERLSVSNLVLGSSILGSCKLAPRPRHNEPMKIKIN